MTHSAAITALSSGEAEKQKHSQQPHQAESYDSYAIMPSTTLFCDVVRTALLKLGYSATEAVGAKGSCFFSIL